MYYLLLTPLVVGFIYLFIALSICFFSLKLTTLAFRNPRSTTFCGAARDLLLLALSILIVKLTTLAFRNPRGTTFCGASRDLLLLALSIPRVKLTTPPYRGPNGTSFARPSFDQPLSALSILFAVIDNTCQPQPAGRDYATHPATYCCKYCRFSKKRGTLFFLRIPLLSHRARDRTRTYTSQNTRS